MDMRLNKTIADQRMKDSLGCLKRALEGKEPNIPTFHVWEWWSGVGLYGFIVANENLHDKEYEEFLEHWIKQNAPNRITGSVNRVIPCCVAVHLYEKTGDDFYKELCDEYADWCLNKALLAENGGFAHVWGPDGEGKELGIPDYEHQVWADSTMMACVFMIRYGCLKNNKKLIEGAIKQLKIHIDALFDQEHDLFYHAYDCRYDKKLGCFWGRGNGWIAASLAVLLKYVDATEYDIEFFKNIFIRLMNKCYSMRAGDGRVHTLIDHGEAYTESTASMLFGYAAAVGRKIGVLETKFIDWAIDIAGSLEFEENGAVKYASSGTGPECTAEEYMAIPFGQNGYTVGLVPMLLSEVSEYLG